MASNSQDYPLISGASNSGAKLFTQNLSATAAAVGRVTLPNQRGGYVSQAEFEYISNGSETVSLTGSYNGGTNDSAALLPFDAATGLPAASTNLAEGIYILPKTWNFQSYEFTGSSTSDVKTIAFAAVMVPK
jgi:hypothetical protein